MKIGVPNGIHVAAVKERHASRWGREFESNSRLFRPIKESQGFRHSRRSDKWVLSPVLSPKEGHKRPWMVRTRRARATIHPSPAKLAVATDAGQRLRKPCRNPGHLRYPRLHPACSQAARQGRARAPQSTMTKVGKSHSKGTFAGAFGNDEDAPIADLPPGRCGFAAEQHHGIDRAGRDHSSIGGA